METQTRISIIVPVFNAAPFLRGCIDSLLAQDYPAFELVLVDDGSTDDSGIILDDYAEKDGRVRVLHTKNAGVSAARNFGVSAATGTYVCFADADDYTEPDMLSRMECALSRWNADIAVCGVRFEDVSGKLLPPVAPVVSCVLSAEEALSSMLYQKLFFTSPWGKLLKRTLAEQNPFPLGTRYEDMATAYRWLSQARCVALDTTPSYHYVQHAESFMGRAFSEERFVQLTVAQQVYDYIKEHHPSVLPAARARRFAVYCQVLLQMPEDGAEYAARRRTMLATMRQDAAQVVRDKNCRRKDRYAAVIFRYTGENVLRLMRRFTGR